MAQLRSNEQPNILPMLLFFYQSNKKSTNLLKGHKITESRQTIAIETCSHKMAIKTVGSYEGNSSISEVKPYLS